MKINKEIRRTAKKLFRECFIQGKLDEKRVRDVVSAVITNQPRGYLGILTELEKLVRLEFEKRKVLIESSTPLETAQSQKIEEQIRRQFKDESLHFNHKVNPSLLGGIRIRIGSDVWDGSVASRLRQLETSI